MSVWSGLVLAVAFLAAMVSTASAAKAPACDLEALRHYPMTDALKQRAIPLLSPRVFFPLPEDAGKFSFDLDGSREGEAKAKAALARGLATFKPVERQILMLAAIDDWTKGKDGMIGFFVLDQSVFADEVIATLDAEGLDKHAALFREGRALFGRDYGTQDERYSRWSDGHGAILDLALDARFKDLSARYRALPSLLDIAAARVAGSDELKAIFDPLRAQATDDQKLAYLGMGLGTCLNHYDTPENVAHRLAQLPPAYARIVIVYIFEVEMLNGAVEQFFYNSSGALAPEIVQAMKEMGLKQHADAVQRGIDMFPKPYLRILNDRRDFMLKQGEDFRDRLEALTGAVDDGEIHQTMIRYARENNIFPN